MPSPLDFIQTLSQKVMSGPKAGPDTKATAGEPDSKVEAFSSALTQALEPKAKPGDVIKGEQAGFELQGEATSKKTNALMPDGLPIELLALQPQPVIVPVDLPPQVAELTQAISQLAVQATLNTPPEPSTQPATQAEEPLQVEALSLPLSIAPKAVSTSSQVIENPTSEAGDNDSKKLESAQETMVLAQSLGFSTLSPEAMLMMGIPVEFQVQNALKQIPTQPIVPEAEMTQAIQLTDLQAILPSSPTAELELEASFPLPTQANMPAQAFDQALQQASPEAIPQATNAITPESAFVIEDAAMQALTPELAPMLELPNGPDSSRFNEVLTQTSPQTLNPELESAPNEELGMLDETAFLPIQGKAKASAEAAVQPFQPRSAEETLKPLADLQKMLESLNGEVESISQNHATTNDSEEFTLPEEAFTDSEGAPLPPLPTDIQAPINLNPNTPADTSNKLPQFISAATDPADQVVDGTVYSVKNGHKELILKINPDNLGEVRINLTSHGDNGLSARLIASNPESHELLKAQADSLKASLEAQGVHIERLSVVLAGQTDSGSNAGQREQDSSHSFQSQQQQQQSSSANQQQSFQQPEQNLNPFFQAGGQFQHKQGFAQNPGGNRYGQPGMSGDNPSASSEAPTRRNDNGSISLLA